ncbi:MAG: hypothetical protein K2G55_12765 [Lachnospiraceae bacterium]|nr:hypothetical protein [Lachnospiraceae bacterium]MDE7205272.1 hypothetical protein [Lachnospiraceae bacterium]
MSINLSSLMSDYYLSSLYRQNSNLNYLSSLYGQNNSAFYLGGLYCQNNVLGNVQSYPNFQSVFAASLKGQDFQGLLTTRFPGVKYHVMDTSRINASAWERNDYPFEKFFEDEIDESVLEWTPTSQDSSMMDSRVQARLNAARGKYAVIVPPELEVKMEEDPSLAQELMNKISALMMQQDTVPGTIDSFNIAFDEDGNISNYRFSGGGGRVMWPSEEEQQKNREAQAENMRRQARIHHL